MSNKDSRRLSLCRIREDLQASDCRIRLTTLGEYFASNCDKTHCSVCISIFVSHKMVHPIIFLCDVTTKGRRCFLQNAIASQRFQSPICSNPSMITAPWVDHVFHETLSARFAYPPDFNCSRITLVSNSCSKAFARERTNVDLPVPWGPTTEWQP
jgi:hypothetical protein